MGNGDLDRFRHARRSDPGGDACCSWRRLRTPFRWPIRGRYALILKALLLVGYVVVLLSQNELKVALPGRVLCAHAGERARHGDDGVSRDLLSVFVALELLSIPAYMMAAWRKRDVKSNEAGVSITCSVYSLQVLLCRPSFLYGTMSWTTEIGAALSGDLTGCRCWQLSLSSPASRSDLCSSVPRGRQTPEGPKRHRVLVGRIEIGRLCGSAHRAPSVSMEPMKCMAHLSG